MSKEFTKKELRRMSQGLPPWESMSFACGGWLQFYLFGVAKSLQEMQLDKGVTYCGCSAGALTAVGMSLEGEFDDAIQFCKDYCLPKAYGEFTGLFNLNEYVTKCLEKYLLPKFAGIEPGLLQIAITRLPFFKKERVVSFETKEELLTTLLASAAAFPFSPIVNIDGKWYIDGGLSDFQPIVDEETITVSPLYFSDCDIKPSRYVPLWWTFMPPRSSDTIDWLYNLGREDGRNYVKSRGIAVKMGGAAMSRINQPASHPYHVTKRVSMHRFLGYDTNKLTNNYISFFMDLVLLLLYLVIWKPLALLLIYVELFVRILLLTMLSTLQTCWDLYPPLMVRNFVRWSYLSAVAAFVGNEHLKSLQLAANHHRKKRIIELWECVTCVWSLSLVLRFFSGRPSAHVLRKHKRLAKMSVLYRVFRHMI